MSCRFMEISLGDIVPCKIVRSLGLPLYISLILLAGCTQPKQMSQHTGIEKKTTAVETRCSQSIVHAMSSLLSSGEIQRVSSSYLQGIDSIPVVVDGYSESGILCSGTGHLDMIIYDDAYFSEHEIGKFIRVKSFLASERSAFLQIRLYPTGIQGNILLERNPALSVAKVEFWEN